jgi:outer membrane protein OmpA-like peptidoglycan-associated protein
MHIKTYLLILVSLLALPVSTRSQTAPNPTQREVDERAATPVYRVTVVGRTTPAINYRHRGGETMVDFRGTALLPDARGEAKVESKQGYIEIEVEFDELEPATKFGPEYLTYVMWAITPEGRATNLGEVLLNGDESKLNVTTELQAYGMIVTAEPYFAVSQPSDVVVMENVVRDDTKGRVEYIEAKYELLKRGTYLMAAAPGSVAPLEIDSDLPLELYEARNAVRLSRLAVADRYAEDSFEKASRLLEQAEEQEEEGAGRRTIVMTARQAVQTAEDARLIALQRQEEEAAAQARAAAAAREAEVAARARAEAERRRLAEEERAAADRARREADEAAQRAAGERAKADAAWAAAERAKADAQAEARRLAEEKSAAEAARAAADAEAARARAAADAAEREQAELRARLQRQLNVILETRESARGLIVNMSDVLFDFAKHTLRPGAREKLARVAGILLAYPALILEVEGHTDSVGSDEYNDRLSERRAASVRDFLVAQGIPAASITARGFGETQPLASNDNAAGRQQNRRVELIVSGETLGQ